MNGKGRVISHLEGRPVDRLPAMPITMMFAADQLSVKYRQYVTDHRTLVEAQLLTAKRFGFDHVSVISDPAREAADLGAEVEFYDDHPPAINESRALLSEKARLLDLEIPNPFETPRMSDRIKAVERFKSHDEDHFIEGWIEGPCAMGADLRGINNLMLDFYDDPSFVIDLFEFSIAMEQRFAEAQWQAGADIIGVGDAASSLVGPRFYRDFVWGYQNKLIDGLHAKGIRVRLHVCGKTRKLYEGMGRLGCAIIDLDWMNPMDEARATMGPEQMLLGNIDPVAVLKNGTPDDVYRGVAECHRQSGERFIVGAGCEIPQGTPPKNVQAMIEYARRHAPDASPT